MLFENALNIYTDGSMLSHPRAGGIGILFVIINDSGNPQVINEFDYPGYRQATNNEMELEACIKGLDEALVEADLQKYSRIELIVQILTVEYLGSPHRLWKYKYEVLSPDSKYCGNLDEAFSEIALRRRKYEVRMNDNTKNPRIVELIRELTKGETPFKSLSDSRQR